MGIWPHQAGHPLAGIVKAAAHGDDAICTARVAAVLKYNASLASSAGGAEQLLRVKKE
jgi:hypothetical protein